MKWELGRQGGEYLKHKIFNSTWFRIDCYLLKFPLHSVIRPHLDPAPKGWNHYRINIVLKKAKAGGKFYCLYPIINWKRIKLFRPDISIHGVTKITKGQRLVLSIGWLKRDKND